LVGFFVFVQNFAQIVQTFVELWAKNVIAYMVSRFEFKVCHLEFKILNFGHSHRILVNVPVFFNMQNFIKILSDFDEI